MACWPAPLRSDGVRLGGCPGWLTGLYGSDGEVVMECRERAMGEYRRRRERGMGREEARAMDRDAQTSANEEMARPAGVALGRGLREVVIRMESRATKISGPTPRCTGERLTAEPTCSDSS